MQYDEIINTFILSELKAKSIDIDDDDFINSDAYMKIKSNLILFPKEMSVTYDYFIEKCILTQERINQIKPGLYDIGTKRTLQPEQLKYSCLYQEILNESNVNDVENIRQKFDGENSGIKTLLKDKIGISLSEFENEKYEQLKLLKLLYKLIKDNANQNLFLILTKPSLENVDNSIVGFSGKNGSVFTEAKSEAMKEITPEFIRDVKLQLAKVGKREELFLNTIRLCKRRPDFFKIIEQFQTKAHEIERKFDVMTIVPNKHTLFETFFLKLLQAEMTARFSDFTELNIYVMYCEKFPEEKIINSTHTFNGSIDKNNISEFINSNINGIVKLIINNEVPDKKLMKKLLSYTPYVNSIINLHEEHSTSDYTTYRVPELMVISCLQEIWETDLSKEEYIYTYHGYKSSCKTLISKLKNINYAEEMYQIIWVVKTKDRYDVNLGFKKQLIEIYKTETILDNIFSGILSINNLDDIQLVYIFVTDILGVMIETLDVSEKVNYILNQIIPQETGYTMHLNNVEIYNAIQGANLEEFTYTLLTLISSFKNQDKQNIELSTNTTIITKSFTREISLNITLSKLEKSFKFSPLKIDTIIHNKERLTTLNLADLIDVLN